MRPGHLIPLFIFALSLFSANLFAATSIPFEYRDGMIWVRVSMPGKNAPLNFLLDSGAGVSVVDLTTARRLGLRLLDSRRVLGAHGRSIAYRVEQFAGQAGDVAVASSVLSLDLGEASRHCHQHIDGLLGADFFQEHIVEINFGTQTLRLLNRAEISSAGCEALPLTRRNDTLCAQVSVDGSAPEWLRLDTGCNTSLEWVVSTGKAKRLRASVTALKSGSVPEIETGVQLGGLKLADVKTGIHTEPMFPNETGLIGNGLLSRFTVTIDAAKQQCLLAKR